MDKGHMNRAFRQAYDFLEAHQSYNDCAKIASDIPDECAKCQGDSLTMRLIFAVYDYLGAEAGRGNNDAT